MPINETMRAGMKEAIGLLRGGRHLEATAVIQRKLRGLCAPRDASDLAAASKDAFSVGNCHVVDDGVASPARLPSPQWRSSTSAAGHRAPASEQLRPPFAGPSRTAPTSSPRGGGESRAPFITGSYTGQAGTRSYKLYVPSSYQGQALPLVVMLHGCTQTPEDFAAGTCMNEAAEEQHCFVVYPAQAIAANHSNCWNWFRATDQERDRGEPSLIAGITRQIISTYCVDVRRVYVAGLSAGGAMAAIMGITYPDLYAAIGVHSGLPYAAAHDVPSAFTAMSRGAGVPHRPYHRDLRAAVPRQRVAPAIVFHGDRDTTVHARNGDQVVRQWKALHGDHVDSLHVTVHQGTVPHGHAFTRETYQEASGQIILEQWRVHGAEHAWSGGSRKGSYTDPRGPDATREMVRFFLGNLLP